MTSPKRKHNQDDECNSDKFSINNKRLKAPKIDAKEELMCQAASIINRGFNQEESKLEERVFDIQNRISSIQEIISEVRLAVVSSTYARPECMVKDPKAHAEQTRIHPAVKKLLGIRVRKRDVDIKVKTDSSEHGENVSPPAQCTSSTRAVSQDSTEIHSTLITKKTEETLPVPVSTASTEKLPSSSELTKEVEKPSGSSGVEINKFPRYIPPALKEAEACNTLRGTVDTSLVVIRLIVGNVSKWLPADTREDRATHKWMMYIRIKDVPNSSKYISKVRYMLDPSYKPNDLVEVSSPPFYLTRRGWGEFPVRVQIHFRNPLDKPVDIRHFLKLDTTYSGQENLGLFG